MTDPSPRPARKVGIADHIWETFEEMARQMGSDRDALINQALFVFARLHGFDPAAASRPSRPVAALGEAAGAHADPHSAPTRSDEPLPGHERAEHVLASAAEVERRIHERGNGAEAALLDDVQSVADEDLEPEEALPEAEEEAGEGGLYIALEGSPPKRVNKRRFVIGRGKHCDFVINSGKVSREHAVIVREGADYFIEDLGSSNGTWFNQQRIRRRRVDDGDEYLICSEKVVLSLR